MSKYAAIHTKSPTLFEELYTLRTLREAGEAHAFNPSARKTEAGRSQ